MHPAETPLLAAEPGQLRWNNRFRALGAEHHTELAPQLLPQPHWVATSAPCAAWLGLPPDWADSPAWASLAVLAGNRLWPGMQPLASVYSGHQFGQWAGQLGDGRALMLGELQTPGGLVELQLKGAGMTPYSRSGDGRAVLRSSIREFLCSEAMHALGIPTTRALAIVGSPLKVRRETVETAAVVTRAAPSFLRFGHFEHFAHTADNPSGFAYPAAGAFATLPALDRRVPAPAPLLGADSEQILAERLKLSSGEIARLIDAGIVGTAKDNAP